MMNNAEVVTHLSLLDASEVGRGTEPQERTPVPRPSSLRHTLARAAPKNASDHSLFLISSRSRRAGIDARRLV